MDFRARREWHSWSESTVEEFSWICLCYFGENLTLLGEPLAALGFPWHGGKCELFFTENHSVLDEMGTSHGKLSKKSGFNSLTSNKNSCFSGDGWLMGEITGENLDFKLRLFLGKLEFNFKKALTAGFNCDILYLVGRRCAASPYT